MVANLSSNIKHAVKSNEQSRSPYFPGQGAICHIYVWQAMIDYSAPWYDLVRVYLRLPSPIPISFTLATRLILSNTTPTQRIAADKHTHAQPTPEPVQPTMELEQPPEPVRSTPKPTRTTRTTPKPARTNSEPARTNSEPAPEPAPISPEPPQAASELTRPSLEPNQQETIILSPNVAPTNDPSITKDIKRLSVVETSAQDGSDDLLRASPDAEVDPVSSPSGHRQLHSKSPLPPRSTADKQKKKPPASRRKSNSTKTTVDIVRDNGDERSVPPNSPESFTQRLSYHHSTHISFDT